MAISGDDYVKKSFAMDGIGSMVLNPNRTNSSGQIILAEEVSNSKKRMISLDRVGKLDEEGKLSKSSKHQRSRKDPIEFKIDV